MRTLGLYAPALVLIVWSAVVAVTGTVVSPVFLTLLVVSVLLDARELTRRYGRH